MIKAIPFPYLAFLFTLGVFLLLPSYALADIDTYDTPDTYSPTLGGNDNQYVIHQPLGTGITGTVTAGTYDIEVLPTGSGSFQGCGFFLWEYNTEADYLTDIAAGTINNADATYQQNCVGFGVSPSVGINTFTWNGASGTMDGVFLNASYYYIFGLSSQSQPISSGNREWRFLGQTYSAFPDTCFITITYTTPVSGCSPTVSVAMEIIGIGDFGPPPVDTRTRIITVTPPDDPTGSAARATSTTFAFEATGYVNDANYRPGMRLIIKARNNVAAASNAVGPLFSEGGNAICSWLPDWLCPPLPGEEETYTFSGPGSYEFEFPITASGDFSVATTTDVQVIGRYTMFTTIEQPNETFFGLSESYSQFVSTTTLFTVATSSSYDRAIGSTVEAIVASQTAIDPECSFDFFTPSNYLPAIQTCITSIFAVPTAYVADGLMGAMSDLLSHAPWGYATRVYVILTEETASSTLPSLAVDVPDGLPMGGTALPDFAPWSGIEVAVAQLDVADVETMEGSPLENFEFWWNFMWSLMFAFWLIREIYGMAEMGDFEDLTERMGMAGGRAHGRIRRASNGQRYQEYTNTDVKRAMRRGSRKGVIH